jgi:excisionase family DNA binding protein
MRRAQAPAPHAIERVIMNQTIEQPTKDALPETQTLAEVADVLRVSEDTVRRLAEAGDIPGAFKVGQQWRFNRDKLRQMMNA